MKPFKMFFTILITSSMVTMIGCGNSSSQKTSSQKTSLTLFEAIKNNDENSVKQLINEGTKVNDRVQNGITPLIYAVFLERVEITKLLIGAHANVNLKADVNLKENQFGYTPLHIAVRNSNVEIINLLINAPNADVNISDFYGFTPLHMASGIGNVEIVNLLIKAHANVNLKAYVYLKENKFGETPLHIAVRNSNVEITKLLIEAHANVDISEHYGFTPLHMASGIGNVEIVNLLIKAHANVNLKADVNLKENQFGYTPLHIAVRNSNVEIINLLINAPNADVNVTEDEFGFTPLHMAAFIGNVEIVNLLIKAHANVNLKVGGYRKEKKFGYNTPLHIAVRNSNVEIVNLLINAPNADVNVIENEFGFTPLHMASANGNVEIVNLLIKAHANVNLKADVLTLEGNIGYTPLQIAVKNSNVEITKLLIEAHANVDIMEFKFGFTPLHMASGNGNVEIVNLLIKAKAKINEKSKQDFTPLMLAICFNKTEVEKTLKENNADPTIGTPEACEEFKKILETENFNAKALEKIFYKDQINSNSLFLNVVELGMKRLVTITGYFVRNGVKCNFILTNKEEITGINNEGKPETSREFNFKNESLNPICQEVDEFKFDFPITTVADLLEDIDGHSKDDEFDPIKDFKNLYRIKYFEIESDNNTETDYIVDLNRPLFFNPIKASVLEKINNNENFNIKIEVTELK